MSAAIRLKQLQEQRGAKLKEASALSTTAQKENRALKPEEFEKIKGLSDEVEGIDTHQHKESAYESFTPVGSSAAGAHAGV